MIGSRAGDAIDSELIVDLGAVAHHAGCLKRIHWDQAHCARDVKTISPIGHSVKLHPTGQGVGRLPIRQRLNYCLIGLRLREPPICD